MVWDHSSSFSALFCANTGSRPKPVSSGLGCGLSCPLARLSHNAAAACDCSMHYNSAMPLSFCPSTCLQLYLYLVVHITFPPDVCFMCPVVMLFCGHVASTEMLAYNSSKRPLNSSVPIPTTTLLLLLPPPSSYWQLILLADLFRECIRPMFKDGLMLMPDCLQQMASVPLLTIYAVMVAWCMHEVVLLSF